MTYTRVIPRDLFNEAKLLKSYGQLALLILDNKVDGLPLELQHDYITYTGFSVKQDGMRGHFYCDNLHLVIAGRRRIMLGTVVNSRMAFPMVFVTDEEAEECVFDDKGKLTDEFKTYCRHLLEELKGPTGNWTKVGVIRHYSVWFNNQTEVYNVTPNSQPPTNDAGYPILESLIKCKGFGIEEYRAA